MHHPPSRPHRASKRLLQRQPQYQPAAMLAERQLPLVSPAPVHLGEVSPRVRQWLRARKISLALSTGEAGKVLTIGAGESGLTVFDVGCDLPGALLQTAAGLHVVAQARLWRFDDAFGEGEHRPGALRLCLPSQCRPTGAIGIQDLAAEESGRLLVAAARFNCIARMNSRGDLKPVWRPAFIDPAAREDRCHLTGFCLGDGGVGYVTLTAATNEKDGWRQRIAAGGQVIDAVTHKAVAEGLALPRAPRLHRDRLWLLESGTGWLGWIDREQRRFERFAQVPGFPRGLRIVGDHALVVTARHRAGPDAGRAGIHWINLKTGATDHVLALDSAIAEAVDVAVIPGETVPRLAGLSLADAGQAIGQVAV